MIAAPQAEPGPRRPSLAMRNPTPTDNLNESLSSNGSPDRISERGHSIFEDINYQATGSGNQENNFEL